MTTMSLDPDLDNGDLSKDGAVANPYLARCKIRHVVAAVNLIDSVETPFLYHGLSTAGTFLCRLKQESDCLVAGDESSLIADELCACEKHSHVSIMAAHVSIGRNRQVL